MQIHLIGLRPQEEDLIVAFLKTLTDERSQPPRSRQGPR
jgi:hypothetical protein